jgi:GAF domain-containing protein
VRPPGDAAPRRRAPNEDLIGELFEEMHQIHFMPDVATGAEYVLNILARILPSEGVLIHVFDINTRQFVVVRARGPNARALLLHKTADTFPLFRESFRRGRTAHFRTVAEVDGYREGRFGLLGVEVRTALCGPVQQGGRYLGIVEVANPAGEKPFHDGEVNALDYICEQFADFIAGKPIVLDEDAIVPRT